MKRWMALTAILAAMMMATACGASGDSGKTETEQVTEAATEEAENSAESSETEAGESQETVDLSNGLDDNGYLVDVNTADYVTLPDYAHAEFAETDVKATQEEIQGAVDEIMASYAETVEVTDRAVENGDTVVLDYVGSIDGVPFDGGNSQGTRPTLVIGSHSFIDTFEDQLIGHTPGEEVTVVVTFPENYGKDELNGKEAEFQVTLHAIQEKKIPELTDAFVAENMKEHIDVDTVEGLNQYVEDALSSTKGHSAIWTWLMDHSEFKAEPDVVTETILDNHMAAMHLYVQRSGYTMEQYLAVYGMESEEALREYYRPDAVNTAKLYVIAQAIAEAENLQVEDADIAKHYGGDDFQGSIDTYGLGYVKMQARYTQVADWVLAQAVIK